MNAKEKYQLMEDTSIKQEGAMVATVRIRMYPGRPDSGWVPMIMVLPIVQVTPAIAKIDEDRPIYFSLN